LFLPVRNSLLNSGPRLDILQRGRLRSKYPRGVQAPTAHVSIMGDQNSVQEAGQDGLLEAEMPIAIIGMSCRFPGEATSPEKLWRLCADGRSAWSEIPKDRFNKEAFYHPENEKRTTVS
jgi:hypothetical protein